MTKSIVKPFQGLNTSNRYYWLDSSVQDEKQQFPFRKLRVKRPATYQQKKKLHRQLDPI